MPGPIGTGREGEPRGVYGPEGRVQAATGLSSSRLAPERCARLVLAAAARGLPEAWIARHPVLLLGYLRQYAPRLAWRVLDAVPPLAILAATTPSLSMLTSKSLTS